MGFGWTKSLALSSLLLVLLAACHPGPYQRSYARTADAGYSTGYGGCGGYSCNYRATPQYCPPGHVLTRIPYAYGGPGRSCKPYYRSYYRSAYRSAGSCCGSSCGGYGGGSCGGY